MTSRCLALALALAVAACGRTMPEPPVVEGSPIRIETTHLQALGLDLAVAGRRVRGVALYADAPAYRPTASPERDGSEGVACVDDAARAAVLYLRLYETNGSPDALREARGLLDFVVAMEQGNGEYVNFVAADGTLNTHGPTSAMSFSYWAARALWALGEAVRVLGPRDPGAVAALRPVLDRTVARFKRDLDAGTLVAGQSGAKPANAGERGSTTATAEALLGLLAYQAATPSEDKLVLIGRAADLLVATFVGDDTRAPWGAHVDPGAAWHAWGARTVEALARAAIALDRPELAQAARREADGLWLRLLLTGQVPASIARDGQIESFPQIAYGVSPIVLGYLALAHATRDERYAALAGLAAAWFYGANPAGAPIVDEASGRVFDGIGTAGVVNRNSGAESTVEGLLALLAVSQEPVAADHARYRSVQSAPAPLSAPGTRREFVGKGSDRLSLVRAPAAPGGFAIERPGATTVHLTYWPAANPVEVELARGLVADWNRAHPDIQVHVQPIPAGRTSEEVLLAAIVAKSTPDVCSNISVALLPRLHRARGVVRLDTITSTAARFAERTTPEMLQALRLPDGGIYALPWKVNPLMILYNVDLLAAAGVAPPRTHSELLAVARQLVRDTNGDGRFDRWAMWMPLKMSWHERFYDFYPLYLAASGGRTLLENGEVVFDNPAALGVFDLLRQGFNEQLFPRANFSDGRDPFVDGTVAMKMIGPWFLRELELMKVEGLRYEATPVPVPDGAGPDRAYAFSDMKGIAVFATTAHPKEAAAFAAFLASPEADRRMIELSAQLPYRRGLTTDPRFRVALARWPTLTSFAARVERTRDLDLHLDVVEILDILSEAYEAAAIYGVEPTAGALARAAREARTVADE